LIVAADHPRADVQDYSEPTGNGIKSDEQQTKNATRDLRLARIQVKELCIVFSISANVGGGLNRFRF
jgi:hypothetical protein